MSMIRFADFIFWRFFFAQLKQEIV